MKDIKTNCHTHTSYCDGKNTAEEMIEKAIEAGFTCLGFSGHSPVDFENDWAMSEASLECYYKEITALKEKYKDRIDILCGIELDSDYEFLNKHDFDYVISSVHQIHKNGKIYSVDYTAEELSKCVLNEYDGDWNKMAEEYFESLCNMVLKEKTDVVGHFDLITKFNKDNCLFDENNKEYQNTALKFIDKILMKKPDVVFEVNTGAMFRCGNEKPYPASFILKRIKDRGGRVTITSDAHQTDALDFAFDTARAYCKECGFDKIYHLTKDGFIPEKV